MAVERTLVLVKPDAVRRRLIGEIVSRIERKGLKIVAMKMVRVDRKRAEKHYAVHEGKRFYESLLDFITGGPVVALAVEGEGAIGVMRNLMGPTFGFEAPPGTIRGDYCLSRQANLVHGSDGADTAAYELPIWFDEDEMLSYSMPDDLFFGEE